MTDQNAAAANFTIKPETAALTDQVEQMLDFVFGPARYDKASYLFRDGVAPLPELSYVAMLGDEVVGTIRYWPILVGPTNHPCSAPGPARHHAAPRWQGHRPHPHLPHPGTRRRDGPRPRAAGRRCRLLQALRLRAGGTAWLRHARRKRPERLQVAPLTRDVLGRISGDIRHIHGAVAAQPSGRWMAACRGDRPGSDRRWRLERAHPAAGRALTAIHYFVKHSTRTEMAAA